MSKASEYAAQMEKANAIKPASLAWTSGGRGEVSVRVTPDGRLYFALSHLPIVTRQDGLNLAAWLFDTLGEP